MPVFEYKALTEKGEPTRGIIDADTPKEARDKLRSRRVHVTDMVPLARSKGGAEKVDVLRNPLALFKRKGGGRGSADVPMVTRQLATLLKAGIPLADALSALIQQIESRHLERAFRQIKEDIASGSGTAEAFARHPQFFNDLYVNMIKAGEASGNLDEILRRLADFLQKQSKNRGKVTAALVYPIVLVGVGSIVVTLLMTIVVPKIVASIVEKGAPLPLPTELLIGVSNFFKSYWLLLLGAGIAVAFAYAAWTATPGGRLKRDTILLRLPIFGTLFKKQSVGRFASTFATLLRSGIPALECLKILRDVVDNELLARTIDQVHDRIVEGADIATPLKNSGVFPPVVGYMIAIGEQSGQLEDILEKISEAYDEEIEVTTQKVTALIEPVIIVVMAVVVAFIVMSVILPIFQSFGNVL
jgi:general secretion pathway protein F